METKAVLEKIINEKVEDTKDELNTRITKNKLSIEKRIEEIFLDHLYYEPIVGPGPQNEFHTLS